MRFGIRVEVVSLRVLKFLLHFGVYGTSLGVLLHLMVITKLSTRRFRKAFFKFSIIAECSCLFVDVVREWQVFLELACKHSCHGLKWVELQFCWASYLILLETGTVILLALLGVIVAAI